MAFVGKERISLHIPRSSGISDDVMKITEIVPNYVLVEYIET